MTEIMPNHRAERIRKLLADLIAFDTVSDRSNLPLIAYIEKYLASFGITGRRILDDTGQKASLWATIGPEDRPVMVLSAHTDVAPGASQSWTIGPSALIGCNVRIYGPRPSDIYGSATGCLAMAPA